jgi:acylaminoacyl-peptidase
MSPDRKKVAYFGTPLKPPHLNNLALHVFDLETGNDQCIIPIVKENVYLKKIPEKVNQDIASFSGISGFYDLLFKIYWVSDSKHLIFQSITGCATDVFLVDCEGKELTKLTPNDHLRSNYWNILYKDPVNDRLIVSFEHMRNGPYAKLMILNNLKEVIDLKTPMNKILDKLNWKFININEGLNSMQKSLETLFKEKFQEKVLKYGNAEALFWSLDNHDRFSEKYYEYFPSYQKPEPQQAPYLKPLIVAVHGGPHGNCSGDVELKIFSLLKGYSILAPNFTGSCGYGQDHIENLMGKIGQIDADEIVGFIKQLIDQKLCDPKKIIIIGGSYGGYLAGT